MGRAGAKRMHALALPLLIGLQRQAPVGIQLLPELFEEVS